MKKIFVYILLLVSVVLLICTIFNLKKISSMDEEILKLKEEKITLLSEHEECLAYKEQSLRKELIAKYLDSMMALVNKTENGYTPTEKDISVFNERADFILENIGSIKVSPEETGLVRSFVDSAKKTLYSHINNK